MTSSGQDKLEHVIELVRLGLEGDAAIAHLQKSGFTTTSAGIARNLRRLGGRGEIARHIAQGRSNAEIVHQLLPPARESEAKLLGGQPELFEGGAPKRSINEAQLFPSKKMTIQIPAELFEAIRLAARAEGKTQNQVIVELLTYQLSRMPVQQEFRESEA